MAYTPFHADWHDQSEALDTPITADALEYIEAGIVDAAADADTALTNAAAAQAAADAAQTDATDALGQLSALSEMPAGVVLDYAGSAAPTGYLLCDGSSLLRADYAALFAAIGTAYGAADGTHFNVPDFRGRMAVGKGSHVDVDTLGDNDGAALADRRPKHQHTVYDPGHTHQFTARTDTSPNASTNAAGNFVTQTTQATGSSTTGVKVNPEGASSSSSPTDAPSYLVVNKIIKT